MTTPDFTDRTRRVTITAAHLHEHKGGWIRFMADDTDEDNPDVDRWAKIVSVQTDPDGTEGEIDATLRNVGPEAELFRTRYYPNNELDVFTKRPQTRS